MVKKIGWMGGREDEWLDEWKDGAESAKHVGC